MIDGRGVAGAALSLVLSAGLLLGATRGGTVFTTEGARAADIAAHPVRLPALSLLDARSHAQSFSSTSRITIVDFIYTRCPSVCGGLGGVFQRLQREIARRQLQDRVRLLTVSFDPAADTPERLGEYERLIRADTAVWTIATFRDSSELNGVLSTFGVRVIPDGRGGFEHNAALHVVDRTNQLVRIAPIAVSSLDQRATTALLMMPNDALDNAIGTVLAAVDSMVRRDGARQASIVVPVPVTSRP